MINKTLAVTSTVLFAILIFPISQQAGNFNRCVNELRAYEETIEIRANRAHVTAVSTCNGR